MMASAKVFVHYGQLNALVLDCDVSVLAAARL